MLGPRMCGFSTVPAIDAWLSALFRAPWSLPALQNGVPWNILCRLLFPCGCRATCWGLSWDTLSHDQEQSRPRLGKEKRCHPSWYTKHIPYPPKALLVPIAGVQRPPCQSHTPKICPFLHGKRSRAQFLHGGCRGGSKAPRDWKTKPIWPLFLAPHGFNPKYFNPRLGFHERGVGQRGLGSAGWTGRVHAGLQPF